jgi:DNA-binding transcriptional regulator GbsR (MarR family)
MGAVTYVCPMNYKEAREEFIATWGTLGNEWGINRTMSQIHALLLISPEPLTTEDLMTELLISRGNANMNIHSLMDWGLIQKVLIQGERKEYFQAEKDVWKIARIVARERKKRELDPMLVLFSIFKVAAATGRQNISEAW